MTRVPFRLALLLSTSLPSCASYNAMWNAQRHANEARRLAELGQPAAARAEWAQAAAKAAKVTGDNALVLRVEALAYAGACQDLAEPLARARTRVNPGALRERVDLADAECAIRAGDAARADAALLLPLASRDAERRSRAEDAAGRAATLRKDYDSAAAHFSRSRAAGARERASIAHQKAKIARATDRRDLAAIAADIERVAQTVSGTDEASHQVALLDTLVGLPETPAARFRAAELARDSLQAPVLAGHLFLEVASDTASLFAPKALIAAIPLLPERRDSIIAVLDSRYADSPYTRVFHGEASIAYVAAEDSLARALGVAAPASTAPARPRSDVPLPGPRGPTLP